MSDLRETLIPVCKIVNCVNDASGGNQYQLNNTALQVESITLAGADLDIFPIGETEVNVCALKSADGNVGVSATATVVIEQQFSNSALADIRIDQRGVYDDGFDLTKVVVSGPGNTVNGVGSVTFSTANIPVSYITVTDLTGNDAGFFRVAPASGTSYYLSSLPLGIDDRELSFGVSAVSGAGSGMPGVIAAAGSTAILTLPEPIDMIHIENLTTPASDEGLFAINYGMVKSANRLRDDQARQPK